MSPPGGTDEDVLTSVDTCVPHPRTVDDDPSTPSHCVLIVVGTTVDDVEVSVSSVVNQTLVYRYPLSPHVPLVNCVV